MISQSAANYAKVLVELNINEKCMEQVKNLLLNCSEVFEVLENPVIKKQEKDSVIDALFDKEICTFLKVLSENKMIGAFSEIMEAYENLMLEKQNRMKARLSCFAKPEEEQLEQIKRMLCEKYKKTEVILETEVDTSLIGGYVLYVGDTEYNKSIKGALTDMQKTLTWR